MIRFTGVKTPVNRILFYIKQVSPMEQVKGFLKRKTL